MEYYAASHGNYWRTRWMRLGCRAEKCPAGFRWHWTRELAGILLLQWLLDGSKCSTGVSGPTKKYYLAMQRKIYLCCWIVARHVCLSREVVYGSMSCRCTCRFGLPKRIATMDRWIKMPRLKCVRLIWIGNIRVNYFWLSGSMTPQVTREEMQRSDGLMTKGCT